MSSLPMVPYKADDRGNRLQAWATEQAGQRRFLLLRGSNEVAHHVVRGIPGSRHVELIPPDRPRWTHRLELPKPLGHAEHGLLQVLRDRLVLCTHNEIDGALALDFHKMPPERQGERLQRTAAGHALFMVKYRFSTISEDEVRRIGRGMCGELAAVVRGHPWFSTADVLLGVPPSSTVGPRISARIAATLKQSLGIRTALVEARHEHRKSAKDMSPDESDMLLDEFTVAESLAGQCVLVVDDVCRTGKTMRGVARAARTAGAETVLGLVVTRTYGR